MIGLASACVATVRLVVPGWVWLADSSRPDDPARDAASPVFLIGLVARAMVLGLGLNLAAALVSAQLGVWSPTIDWAVWGIIVLAGLWVRLRQNSVPSPPTGSRVLLVVFVLLAVTMLSPPRSEWLAGGWDPGVYQNQAVAVSRGHGFTPMTVPVYADLDIGGRSLVSRVADGYCSVLPGVPINLATGRLPHYFFQLTPLFGSLLFRWGGLDMLCRLGQLCALLSIPLLVALASGMGLGRKPLFLALLAWLLAPVWWYQQAVPTSEWLQLLLVMGAAVFYLDAERDGRPRAWFCWMLLALAGVNRFSFPPLGAAMLVVIAAAESIANRPGRVGRIVGSVIALTVGVLWDLAFSAVTLNRLQTKDNVLPMVLIPFVLLSALAAILLIVPLRRVAVRNVRRATGWGSIVLVSLLVLVLVVSCIDAVHPRLLGFVGRIPVAGALLSRWVRMSPFYGAAWLTVALAGAALMARPGGSAPGRLRACACAIGGSAFLLLLNPQVAPLYPWALRRYMVFILPFAALAAGGGLATLPGGGAGWRRWARTAVLVIVVLALVAMTGKTTVAAARVGDYVGLRPRLDELDQHLAGDDVIVADDARWGTPLLLAYGRNVLNGSLVWQNASAAYTAEFMEMLRDLEGRGYRIVWFTSTADGMAIYPDMIGEAAMVFDGGEFVYAKVIHSPRADHFAQADDTRHFRLFRAANAAP